MEAKTLALYLGCDVVNQYGSRYKLTGVYTKAIPQDNCQRIQVFDGHHIFWFDLDKIQLLLRPLSSVTEKESSECPRLAMDKWGNATLESMAKLVNHLRSLGVDCDGLIEKGEAIDSTKL